VAEIVTLVSQDKRAKSKKYNNEYTGGLFMAHTTRQDKARRQEKILELVKSGEYATQEALLEKLEERGFKSTQPTLSRDMNELNILLKGGKWVVEDSQDNLLQKQLRSLIEAHCSDACCHHGICHLIVDGGYSQVAKSLLAMLKWDEVFVVVSNDSLLTIVCREEGDEKVIYERLQLDKKVKKKISG